MSWAEAFENINYISVALGAVISLVLGAVWYEPRLLGSRWMKQVGLSKKQTQNKDGMGVMMGQSVLFYGLISLVIAAIFEMIYAVQDVQTGVFENMGTAGEGLLLGVILGFVFGFGPIAVTYGFARRRSELTFIDGGYVVITCAAIGLIVGLLG